MNKKFTKEMINNYAEKLLIGLTEDENNMVLKEFEVIDKNIDLINQIENIKSVEPMSYTLDDFSYELREDTAKQSVPIEKLLLNCDDIKNNEVKVPKVVE